MQPPKIIVHIGHGKTGSSSIQSTLAVSSEELAASRALYLGLMLENGGNTNRRPWQLQSGSLQFFEGMSPGAACQQLEAVFRGILEAAEKDGFSKIIWSNEWLLERPDHCLPVLHKLHRDGISVEIQCYVRRHDMWARSAYVQWGLKYPEHVGDIRPFREWIKHWKKGRALRFYDVIEPWHQAFGASFRLFNYDTIPDVVSHFVRTNHLPPLTPVVQNIAPSIEILVAWALLNARGSDISHAINFDDFLAAVSALPEAKIRNLASTNFLPSATDLEDLRSTVEPDRILVNRILGESGEEPLSFSLAGKSPRLPNFEELQLTLAKSSVILSDRLASVVSNILINLSQIAVLRQLDFQQESDGSHIQSLELSALSAASRLGGDLPHNVRSIATALQNAKFRSEIDKILAGHTSELDALRQETQALRVNYASRAEALNSVTADRDALAVELLQSQIALARARQRPLEQLRDYLRFQLLTFLSRRGPPLPKRTAARFAKSAQKRDPNRSLPASLQASTPMNRYVGSRDCQYFPGNVEVDPTKPHILVVSHDATRTGAPVLVYNLVRALGSRYNVSTLCLRGGELIRNYQDISVKVIVGNGLHGDPSQYQETIKTICDDQAFAFAVVNSVVSRAVLKCLRDQGIPNLALIHEFATYISPRSAFQDMFIWADQVVFSSRLTLENALDTVPLSSEPLIDVIAQGKCDVPASSTGGSERLTDREWLRNRVRPDDEEERRFVVIGAGMAELRKGVELFIETAQRVTSQPGGENAYFFWIGGNYNPEVDFAYSAFLKDQIIRSNLADRVAILPPTDDIEYAYELADVFLLSSRLDPLPNVAIDALTVGLPVVCFQDATGIADYLCDAGLGDSCVARYLDTNDIADKVLALAKSSKVRADIGARCKNLASEKFDFLVYAEQIEKLALASARRIENRINDVQTILDSGRFRSDFFCIPRQVYGDERNTVYSYATALTSAAGARKPEPGFHPQIYAEINNLRDVDPYADYLRKDMPDGPWRLPVIELGADCAKMANSLSIKTALHIHAYFPSELPQILDRLNLNSAKPTLFVSVADQSGAADARAMASSYTGQVGEIRIVPNIGRDIAPLLSEFGSQIVEAFDVAGHIHTKKTTHADAKMVADWTNFLYENLLGGRKSGAAIDHILCGLAADSGIGLIYPDDPNIVGWTMNRSFAKPLARRFGLASLPRAINFPVGTMFWMRTGLLKRFTDLGLRYSDYPSEPLPIDGTMLHALERLIGVVPSWEEWRVAVTNVRGVSR